MLFAANLYVNDPVEEAMKGGEEVVRLVDLIKETNGIREKALLCHLRTRHFKRKKGEKGKGDQKGNQRAGKEAEKSLGVGACHKEQPTKPKEVTTKINNDKFFDERDLGVEGKRE